ncbi:hypothetical protein SmJEL517_g00189 [Synchytrium microbalum]|uniref:Pentacotripeptide-repeat region of PRORP domain-containing protein n=1 Tax=Synchytrium microbalum TaxID=1806994 RepID=A0A507CAS7_9FUNG|nr:uncharacterized protein SmJEL517_g00189 [Synchytrium microbalum]TPX38167.1 hypothetical protein SmJEL517_g00189 [Synchytrium microbalum]
MAATSSKARIWTATRLWIAAALIRGQDLTTSPVRHCHQQLSSSSGVKDELDLLDSVLKAPVRSSVMAGPLPQLVSKISTDLLNLHLYDAEASATDAAPSTNPEQEENAPVTLDQFNKVIRWNASEKRVKQAEAAFKLISEAGFKPDLDSHLYLASAYARVGMLEATRLQIVKAEQAGYLPDVRAYGILINAYVNRGKLAEAFGVYEYMKDYKIGPTQEIFTSLIKGCIRAKDMDRAWKTYEHMRMNVAPPDVYTYSLMIHACSKTKDAERALDLLADMTERGIRPNAYTFNSLIAACGSRADYWPQALELLERMIVEGFIPQLITYKILLKGAALHGDVRRARSVWNDMVTRAAVDAAYRPDEACVVSMMHAFAQGVMVWNATGAKFLKAAASDSVDNNSSSTDTHSNGLNDIVDEEGETIDTNSTDSHTETTALAPLDDTNSEYPIFRRTEWNTNACFEDTKQMWQWVASQAPAPIIVQGADMHIAEATSSSSSNYVKHLLEEPASPLSDTNEDGVLSSTDLQLSNTPESSQDPNAASPHTPMPITLPLLDAYLGVFCKRPSYSKSAEHALDIYNTEYARWGISPGSYTYQSMLRLVTKASKVSKEQRLDVWKQYMAWDEVLEDKLSLRVLDKIEKEAIRVKEGRGRETMFQAFVLMIQGYARANELQEGLITLKESKTFRPHVPNYLPQIHFKSVWNLVERIRNEAEINANWDLAKQLLEVCPQLDDKDKATRAVLSMLRQKFRGTPVMKSFELVSTPDLRAISIDKSKSKSRKRVNRK